MFVNPTIVNEIANLAQNPLEQFFKAFPEEAKYYNDEDKIAVRDDIMGKIRELIEKEILIVLDGDKESVIKQIEITNKLGAADAVNASLAHLYGISFLTVDRNLVRNIEDIRDELSNIKNLYYTTPRHRAYFT